MELIASVSGREAYAGEPIYIASAWMETIDPLRDEDVARAVAFVLTQPKHMAINELVLRPIGQEV